MILNNLKIYCQTEEDQESIVDYILDEYPDVKISTWEPDGEPGSWGMFVDDFPIEVLEMLCRFLDSDDAFVLDEQVEMVLECDEPRINKYYP